MTREEIKNTPEIVDFMLSESVMSESKEKLHKRLDEICNLAIQTLEQEPKEIYNKGYTDGQKALSEHLKLCKEEQEPKTGHWIETDEWRETVDGFEQWGYFRKCNKCGYVFKFLEIDNYCPNCGIKMESEEE